MRRTFFYCPFSDGLKFFKIRPLIYIFFYSASFEIVYLVAEMVVYFISVVFFRIVAGSYHDTAVGLHISYGERNYQHRRRLIKQAHVYASAAENAGRLPGVALRAGPGVIAYHYFCSLVL